MHIVMQTTKQSNIRASQCGDWMFDEKGNLQVFVSENVPENEQFLIALHELVEAWLCREREISQKLVDEFDAKHAHYEGEPGDLPDCPYRIQHRVAMLIEHLMAHEMGMTGYGKVE